MEKKGNKTIIGILVVIIIILLVLIGLIYTGTINITKVNSNKQQISNNSEISKKDAKYLLSKYIYANNYYNQPLSAAKILDKGLEDKSKALITILNSDATLLENQYKDIDCLKAFPNVKNEKADWTDNSYKLQFSDEGYDQISCGIKDNNNIGGTYDYNKLNKVYKYLFGDESDLPKTYVSNALDYYAYSEYYNAYINLKRWGGGPYYFYQYYDISNININNDDLEINIKYLEFDLTNNEKVIYNSKSGNKYEYTYEEVYGVEVNNDYAKTIMKEIYNKEYDYLNEYKFIFGKSDSHYYLKSINKVN